MLCRLRGICSKLAKRKTESEIAENLANVEAIKASEKQRLAAAGKYDRWESNVMKNKGLSASDIGQIRQTVKDRYWDSFTGWNLPEGMTYEQARENAMYMLYPDIDEKPANNNWDDLFE